MPRGKDLCELTEEDIQNLIDSENRRKLVEAQKKEKHHQTEERIRKKYGLSKK